MLPSLMQSVSSAISSAPRRDSPALVRISSHCAHGGWTSCSLRPAPRPVPSPRPGRCMSTAPATTGRNGSGPARPIWCWACGGAGAGGDLSAGDPRPPLRLHHAPRSSAGGAAHGPRRLPLTASCADQLAGAQSRRRGRRTGAARSSAAQHRPAAAAPLHGLNGGRRGHRPHHDAAQAHRRVHGPARSPGRARAAHGAPGLQSAAALARALPRRPARRWMRDRSASAIRRALPSEAAPRDA